eukprot:TRINITY_DN1550_c0_g2_i1.p1 TRINITY_DN1550_c0_g2~~TRINITY_DN1550_c0_g2_i1.p1  ORF type:complete len:234 (+),score=44.83 TRINITY_DN1550_c0_g2_i1:243-944(+)
MTGPPDQWMKEYGDASKLLEDISARMAERSSLPPSGPDTQHHLSALRRKVTVLSTRIDSLQSMLPKLPSRQRITEKELHRRQDMLVNLRSKANQMASALKMSNLGNRNDLLGDENKPVSEIDRTPGLDNYGLVGLQRQIMKEQDEGLEKLEETVISTKHIALAVNEELDLQSRLLDNFDQDVDLTASRLQRAQRRLAMFSKKVKSGCSCMCLLLMVALIVILAVAIWAIIKYL